MVAGRTAVQLDLVPCKSSPSQENGGEVQEKVIMVAREEDKGTVGGRR